ncbi:MAG: pyruvate kinase [Chloroflexota bacterium]
MSSRAKIVATLGPASQDEETIRQLLLAGVDIARLNFSHGTHEEHAETVQRLRRASQQTGHPIAIMQDLQGPKMRTGQLQDGQVTLQADQKLTLTTHPVLGNERVISVDIPGLVDACQPGQRILLDDGNLELQVTAVKADHVETQVILGGVLLPHKGVNLPGASLCIDGFTPKDQEDLTFGLQIGVDAIAVSFVRNAADVGRVCEAIQDLAPNAPPPPVIAKLERPEALDNLEDILLTADGVMVARGDLGVEMPPETVPIAQKRIIEAANSHSRVVITATQMLDSMIHNPRPTRAEASDVANAIFDGTDAVMLSGETASGKYPVQAVQMMASIIAQAEQNMSEWGHWQGMIKPIDAHDDTYFMTQAACELAHDRNVAAIAIFTQSGRTARLLSKTRPEVDILAFTPSPYTFARLNLYWGVHPHLVPQVNTIEAMIQAVESAMLAAHHVQPGQQVVLICGYPIAEARPTNLALLHTVGV